MELTLPNGLPKHSALLIIIVIGVLAGIGSYQLSARGFLPLNVGLIQTQVQTQQKQTILSEENAVINVVEKVSPGVVAIGATQKVYNPFNPFALPKNESSTIGTGFVVSDKGIIITNKHVVSATNTKYSVVTKDGKKYEIKKIYRDPILDLAIVQIEEGGLTPLEMGDSSKLKVGQTVIAIGNALGKFTNTVTTGVVSGVGRQVQAGDPYLGSYENLEDLIQTDAAINPGNSGGPLLNSAGQVVGVNVATTEGAQNIGFAVPITAVKKIVDEFIQKGTVSRAFLGIQYRFISRDVALMNEVPQGAYIQEVVSESAADKAGLRVGDIITKINGQNIDSENKISDTIAGKKVGDSLNLTVWNDKQERQATANLQELPEQ